MLLGCVIVWGWTFVATKICLASMTPIALLGCRFLIGIPILGAILVRKRIPVSIRRKEIPALLAGIVLITIHFLIQAYGLTQTTAIHSAWIIAITPLVMAVLSYFLLREPIYRRQIAGILLATAGVLLLVSRGNLGNLGWLHSFGDWLVLLSAHTWALYTIVTRDLSRSRHPLLIAFLMFVPLTVLCLAITISTSGVRKLASLPMETVLALLFLGTLGTIAQWFWQEGVARLGATQAGTFLYLEPVATTLLAVPLLGEAFGILTGTGGLLVVAGVWRAQEKKSVPACSSAPGSRRN
jgi:drug/metabolite transporter (DMT)-like permease